MDNRVLLGGLFHETHTFLDGTTGIDQFEIRRDDAMLECAGDASPTGGVLEAAQRFGWRVIPTVDFRAAPSATVRDTVVETFWNEFRERAEPALREGVEGIYLVLHGAMASESGGDVEGEILERIRRLPGAARVPIFGVFDLHANVGPRLIAHATGLVAYRENPHSDARESAVRAATLLQRSLKGGQVPRMMWKHARVLWSPTGVGTGTEPMRSLEAMARAIENERDEIWAVNVAAGYSFADTPDTGASFSLATTGSVADGEAALQRLASHAWQNREQAVVHEESIESVFARILPVQPGLTVLVEPSDNIGGGAPGDGTGLLRALLEYKAPNCAVAISDPDSVAATRHRSVGERVTLSIGGKGSRFDRGPVELAVELVSRREGRFTLEDKQSHLASMCGDRFDMGPCAVVRHEGLTILLTSRPTPPFDLGQWRSQGIEPTRLSIIVVKAAAAHRRAYDPIAARMFWVETPGPCPGDPRALPFRKIKRPIFPLD